ncbi:hypothetical protein KY310_02495 [Candidatus Woesearchaeota archaeon]|nr:hypothetical protein [Candidatus Woesearchaeota archaeon]
MKKILYPIMLVLLSSFAWAQTTGLMHYKDGSAGGSGMLLGLLYFAAGSLIFSVIFWLTHNWLVKKR